MDCAAPRHELEPVEAEPEAFLCWPCQKRLRRQLRRLPAWHAELEAAKPQICRRSSGPGRGQGDGLPYSDAIYEAWSQIEYDLVHWTRRVAADRHVPLPDNTIAAMAGWLSGWLAVIVFRDWAGDMAGAIQHCWIGALNAIDPRRGRELNQLRVPCVTCPEGHIRFVIYEPDDKRESYAACEACGHEWDVLQWMNFGRRYPSAVVAA